MPESTVASVSVIGYTNPVKIVVEDDAVTLTIPSMYNMDADKDREVILYEDEARAVADGLNEGIAQVQRWDEEDEYALPDPIIEVSPMLPNLVSAADQINGVLEQRINQYITAEVPFIIEYTKEGGEEIVRTVSPYEVETVKDATPFNPPKYVRGWDHMRDDIRSFRLTRISALGPARQVYVQPE